MLKIINLTKIYKPKKGRPVSALKNVNLEIGEKGMVFLLGKSGSGKSTLLNLIGGLDNYTSGDIVIKGKSTTDFKQSSFDSYRNTFIGFIFQEFNILEDYNVGKNISLALELQHKKGDKAEVDKILEQVDLEGYYERKPNELSGGQKQRVAIARALVKNPEIIMADEPTGSLDSKTGQQVFDTLKKLSKDKLVIIVTHDRENAEIYGDRIIELADGNVIVDRIRSSDGVTFIDNDVSIVDEKLIRIKAGAKLSNSDVEEINKILEKTTDDVFISLDAKNNVNFSKIAESKGHGKAKFIETSADNNPIKKYDGRDFCLVKSKLPFSDSVKMGASGLKLKKIRLGFTIFLSFIAIALFGFSTIASAINVNQTEFKTLQQNNVKGIVLSSVAGTKSSFGSTYFSEYNSKGFTEQQIKDIEQITKLPSLDFANFSNNQWNSQYNLDLTDNLKNYINDIPVYYTTSINRFLVIPEVPNKENYMGIEKIAGRLPEAMNEIALSDYIADLFIDYGYKSYSDASGINISTADDLIGKTLGKDNIKIVGIYKTDVDKNLPSIQKLKKETGTFSRMLFNPSNTMMGMGLVTSKFGDYVNNNNQIQNPTISPTRLEVEYSNKLFSIAQKEKSQDGTEYLSRVDSIQCVDKYSALYLEPQTLYFGSGKPNLTSLSSKQIIVYYNFIDINRWDMQDIKDAFDNLTAQQKKVYLCFDEHSQDFSDPSKYEEYDVVGIYLGSNLHDKFGGMELYSGILVSDAYYDELAVDIKEPQKPESIHLKSNYNLGPKTPNNYLFTSNISTYYNASAFSFSDVYFAGGEAKASLAADEIIVGRNFFRNIYGPTYEELTDNQVKQRLDGAASSGNDIVYWGSMMTWEGDKLIVEGVKELKVVGVDLYSSNEVYCSDAFFAEVKAIASAFKNRYFRLSGDAATYRALEKFCDKSVVTTGKHVEKIRPDTMISMFMQEIVDQILGPLKTAFLYISIVFSVFAGLMIINFISVSIHNKKKDIGVLRAIGARSADIFKIFLSEGMIIGIINYLLATIAVVVICTVLNNLFTIAVLIPGILQLLYMALLCFGIILISTFIPVRKIASKKPIDAINNR